MEKQKNFKELDIERKFMKQRIGMSNERVRI
jgi:hypothetical protein